MKKKSKTILINLGLSMVSTLVFVLGMELIFPSILDKLPLSIYVALDKGYRPLAQHSKKSLIPKDYIAIVGDSFALGQGDWYMQAIKEHKFSQGDYSSAHVIYRKTGRDVISFGSLGAGSLKGLVSEPIAKFMHINSLRAFHLDPPKMILVYFYEGNDLTDNILDLRLRYENEYDLKRIYDPDYFRNFMRKTVLEKDSFYNMQSPLKNFLFTRFLIESVSDNVANEIRRGFRKLTKTIRIKINGESGKKEDRPEGEGPSLITRVWINGKEFTIPVNNLQAPAMSLTQEETRRALYVFKQALLFLADFFKDSAIDIVYIPSPISSYKLVSPTVSVQTFHSQKAAGNTRVVTPREVYERTREICLKIQDFAGKQHFGFVDTRKKIRQASLKQPVHGPRDWTHFNKAGYVALGEAIVEAFFQNGNSTGFVGCEG